MQNHTYIYIFDIKLKVNNYWHFVFSAKTTLLLKVSSNPLAASDCDVEGGSPLVFRPLSGEHLIVVLLGPQSGKTKSEDGSSLPFYLMRVPKAVHSSPGTALS